MLIISSLSMHYTSVLIMPVPAPAFLLEDFMYLSRGGCSRRYL